ncbi:MAG TPA: hypothetical protein VN841_17530 [Bryobacteraceae bacterium]|nr:hypothetical protein [Bryobacteraceae bacterium]
MKHSTIAKTLTLAAVAALALSVAPTAKAADKGCSNASLKGTFSDKDSGWIYTSPTAAPLPFAGVNVDTFDGNGNLTITGTASVGGNIMPGTSTGTYTVNSDCTGTYTVQSPGLTVHAFFVIDDSESELQIVITDPGNVILCVARRQFPVGDWRQ